MPTKAELRYITFEALAASAFAFDESKVNRKGGKFAKKGEKHSQKSLSGMGYSGPHGGTNYDKSHSQGIHSVSLGDGGIVDKEINYPRSNGHNHGKGGLFAPKGASGGSTSDSSKGAKTRHEAAEEEEPVLQPTDEGGPEEQGPDDLALYDEENDQWAPK